MHFSCSHVKSNSVLPPTLNPSLLFLKHLHHSLVLQSCEPSHHISLMRLQPCDCTEISNSSCLFPLLHALLYRDFWESLNSADFKEELWELPQLYHNICICVLALGVGPFGPTLLIMRFLLTTSTGTLCLPTLLIISSLDGGSSSSSTVIPSLKLSSLFWPPCWQKCFCLAKSGGSCLFLAVFSLQRS